MRQSTRRQFLAVAGATTFAGCTSIIPSGQSDQAPNASNDGTTTPGSTSTGTPASGAPVSYGTVIEDFEDLSRWGTLGGSKHADEQTVYAGSQSARIEAQKSADVGGIFRAFPDGLDLSTHDLSAAVKLEQPKAGSSRRITAVALAPGYSDRIEMKRYLADPLDEWVRVDFGVTGDAGTPDLADVQELRIEVLTGGGEQVTFWVDDLRKVPKPDQGFAIFQFDNTLASHYKNVLPIMQKKGYPAVEGVVPSAVNSEGYLSGGQLREMRDAGWDIVSQPQHPRPLPAYSKRKQRRFIENAHDYLAAKGFQDGAKHMIAPYHQMSGETVDIASEFHETAYMFGACPTPVGVTGSHTISRVNGDSREGLRRLAPFAATYNQAVAMYFPAVKKGGDMDPAELREVIGIVEDAGLTPITCTKYAKKMKRLRSK